MLHSLARNATCEVLRLDRAAALAQADAALMAQAQQILSRYGLALDADGCRDHASWIGDQAFAYRLCPVRGGG